MAHASGNRTLIDMLSMLSDWTLLFMQFGVPPSRTPSATDATHQRILDAIRSGDKELAASTMRGAPGGGQGDVDAPLDRD